MSNFIATTLRYSEKIDHPFFYLLTYFLRVTVSLLGLQARQIRLPSLIWYGLIGTCIIDTACDRHGNETVTLRKDVTKYKNIRKWMGEFLRKSDSRSDKIAGARNSHQQIYKVTLILYGIGVCCDREMFSVHSPLFYREAYVWYISQSIRLIVLGW